jgi:hypothetical protein
MKETGYVGDWVCRRLGMKETGYVGDWVCRRSEVESCPPEKSLPGSIDPKVNWGDGKRNKMESKECMRLDLNHGSPRQYHQSKPGPINPCQAPPILAGSNQSKSILGRWKGKGDGKQRKQETGLESWISKEASSI